MSLSLLGRVVKCTLVSILEKMMSDYRVLQ